MLYLKNIQNKTITAGVILYKFVAKYAYYLTLMYLKIYLVVWEENSTYVFNAGISEKKKEKKNQTIITNDFLETLRSALISFIVPAHIS